MKLRNAVRESYYESNWDFGSVLAQCERKNIPPDKVVAAIKRLHSYCKIPPEKLGGALAITLLKIDRLGRE
mgnify:CR=1 FL=1